jgi:hypothetical protein
MDVVAVLRLSKSKLLPLQILHYGVRKGKYLDEIGFEPS